MAAEPDQSSARVTMVIDITEDNFTEPDCSAREELCFSTTEFRFQVPENTPAHQGALVGTLRHVPYVRLCPEVERKYAFTSGGEL